MLALLWCTSHLAQATPNPTHIFGPSEVLSRLNTVKFYDASSRLYLTPVGSLITEPVLRLFWSGQLFTHSDWIGIQTLLSTSHRIDPGGKDDASNMFIYTCKGGWIDFGHVVFSALAYKMSLQMLRGNVALRGSSNFLLHAPDQVLLRTISRELRSGHRRQDKNHKPLGYEYWAGYFAMRISEFIEDGQHRIKKRLSSDQMKSDGDATSAYTLEDLPSNYYGVLIGKRLERRHTVRGGVRQLRAEFALHNARL